MQANNTKWIKSNWNKHEIQRYLKEYDVKIMKEYSISLFHFDTKKIIQL